MGQTRGQNSRQSKSRKPLIVEEKSSRLIFMKVYSGTDILISLRRTNFFSWLILAEDGLLTVNNSRGPFLHKFKSCWTNLNVSILSNVVI